MTVKSEVLSEKISLPHIFFDSGKVSDSRRCSRSESIVTSEVPADAGVPPSRSVHGRRSDEND